MKKLICLFTAVFTAISLFGCQSDTEQSTETLFSDDLGRQITFTAEDKVAACHASFADCWLLAGGMLTGATADASEEHGLDVGSARIIGTAKTVNTEELVASGATVALLSADLSAHIEVGKKLEKLGIKCAYFKVDTFEDYAYVMERFCRITRRDDLYKKNVTDVRERINGIIKLIPKDESRKALLMRAYSSGIKAKSDDNLAGLILKEFGLLNIADEHPSLLEDMGLEHIVKTDPDHIFVLTMGNEEAALSYLRENIESNVAFSGLTAVINGNYHLLPKELFHYKPNEKWDESYEYLAKILYPEVFNEG